MLLGGDAWELLELDMRAVADPLSIISKPRRWCGMILSGESSIDIDSRLFPDLEFGGKQVGDNRVRVHEPSRITEAAETWTVQRACLPVLFTSHHLELCTVQSRRHKVLLCIEVVKDEEEYSCQPAASGP